MGVNVREGYMRLYNGCTENWNITVQNLVYNILMRCISQCAKYKLCIIKQTEISSVWNLRKRHEFVENIACFLFPFFSLGLIFYGHIILRSYSSLSHFNTYHLIDSSSGWNISNPCGLWDLTKVTKQRQSFHHGRSPNSHDILKTNYFNNTDLIQICVKCFIPCKQFYHIEIIVL